MGLGASAASAGAASVADAAGAGATAECGRTSPVEASTSEATRSCAARSRCARWRRMRASRAADRCLPRKNFSTNAARAHGQNQLRPQAECAPEWLPLFSMAVGATGARCLWTGAQHAAHSCGTQAAPRREPAAPPRQRRAGRRATRALAVADALRRHAPGGGRCPRRQPRRGWGERTHRSRARWTESRTLSSLRRALVLKIPNSVKISENFTTTVRRRKRIPTFFARQRVSPRMRAKVRRSLRVNELTPASLSRHLSVRRRRRVPKKKSSAMGAAASAGHSVVAKDLAALPSGLDSQDDAFSCPVCCDVLHEPTRGACVHVFCAVRVETRRVEQRKVAFPRLAGTTRRAAPATHPPPSTPGVPHHLGRQSRPVPCVRVSLVPRAARPPDSRLSPPLSCRARRCPVCRAPLGALSRCATTQRALALAPPAVCSCGATVALSHARAHAEVCPHVAAGAAATKACREANGGHLLAPSSPSSRRVSAAGFAPAGVGPAAEALRAARARESARPAPSPRANRVTFCCPLCPAGVRGTLDAPRLAEHVREAHAREVRAPTSPHETFQENESGASRAPGRRAGADASRARVAGQPGRRVPHLRRDAVGCASKGSFSSNFCVCPHIRSHIRCCAGDPTYVSRCFVQHCALRHRFEYDAVVNPDEDEARVAALGAAFILV